MAGVEPRHYNTDARNMTHPVGADIIRPKQWPPQVAATMRIYADFPENGKFDTWQQTTVFVGNKQKNLLKIGKQIYLQNHGFGI